MSGLRSAGFLAIVVALAVLGAVEMLYEGDIARGIALINLGATMAVMSKLEAMQSDMERGVTIIVKEEKDEVRDR